MKKKIKDKITNFDQYLDEQLKDREFKKWYDYYGEQLAIARQVLRLRQRRKMTQSELADKVGTTQSNIARVEAGKQNFSIQTLYKLARVFDKKLVVEFR